MNHSIVNCKSGAWVYVLKNKPLNDLCIKDIQKTKKLLLTEKYKYPLDNLPDNLLELWIGNDRARTIYIYTPPLSELTNIQLNNLPFSLLKLTICSNIFDQPLDYLPCNLQELFIQSNAFDQELNNLPNTLKYLHIDSQKFKKVLEYLPFELEKLVINKNYIHLDHIKQNYSKLIINTICG